MRSIVLAFIAALSLCLSSAFAADFQEGLDAYNNGDYADALIEFKPLAEQGDAKAQYNLGVMYAKGWGVAQDDKESSKWYRLAAEQGIAEAQNSLGWFYASGRGVPKDDKEAVKWFHLAAEHGLANAQLKLGAMYILGWGVPLDYIIAYMWFNLAAENGDKAAALKRDEVAKNLSQVDIAKAQERSRTCLASNYKNCCF